MDAYWSEWAALALKWLHVITGVAWVGSSFFFNWLDSRLEKPLDKAEGVEGELWMVHSGGFYQFRKRHLRGGEMPPHLHWVKWEAGWTFISGILLLMLTFWFGSQGLVTAGGPLDQGQAAALMLAVMATSWFIYDAFWQSEFARRNVDSAAFFTFVFIGLIAWGLSHVLTGRALFLQVGAIVGTWMAANVWVRIIPGQKVMVDAAEAGTTPDPTPGINAKLRSLNNNYFTLPVVFLMFSGHYPVTYSGTKAWIALLGLGIVGAGIRHFFNRRNKGELLVWLPGAAAILFAIIAVYMRPPQIAAGERVAFSEVRAIVAKHCASCHSAHPTSADFPSPPKGLILDNPASIRAAAPLIKVQAVDSEIMPLGNTTGMTAEERQTLGRWIVQGAPGE